MADRTDGTDLLAALPERLQQVQARIQAACEAADRDPDSVTLVAASKNQSAKVVQAAIHAGQLVFGENRVQELLAKQEELSALDPAAAAGAEWHMIGSLQRNKVNQLLGAVSLIQSGDRASLLQRISQVLRRSGADDAAPQDVLLEVNYSLEASKQGCLPEEAEALLKEAVGLPGLRVRGLMTMAAAELAYQQQLEFFKDVHKDWLRLRALLPEAQQEDFDILSMGMSDDYLAAIAAGSTMVRVGRAIFGERQL